MSRSRVLGLALLLAIVLPFLFPVAAAAHPLGNFTVNRYSLIEVQSERVTLLYVLDLAEIPTLQELNAAGVSGTPTAPQEDLLLERFSQLVLEGARLSLDGRKVDLSQRSAQFELVPGEAGLFTTRMEFTLAAEVNVRDGAQLEYDDTTLDGRIGWREVVLRAGSGVRLESSTVPSTDQTNGLRVYPNDPLAAPLNVSSAEALVRRGEGSGGVVGPDPVTGGPRFAVEGLATGVSDLVRASANGDVLATALALLAAAGLGAFHAVTPGHGKTVMAAYLVGTRGAAAQALGLGAAVAVSHTLGVLLLGVLILSGSSLIPPERFYPYLSAVSALIVVGIGIWLLVGALRQRAHGHAHEHGHSHDHGHSHGPDHAHGIAAAPIGWRSLVALGISGGLVPSASALLLLLAAVSLQRPDLGLVLIIAFGLGMAFVLVAIGLALVRAGKVANQHLGERPVVRRVAAALPLLTSVVVLLVGTGLSIQAGQQLLASL